MFQYIDQHYEAVSFSGRDLRDGELIRCTFERCSFVGASMEELATSGCRFGGSTFAGRC